MFHHGPCATRDISGAVCGGGGLSGATALHQIFLHFQGAQQSCSQIFWEVDWTAWSKTQYGVEHLHVSGSSGVKEGEYFPRMGSLRRIKL